MLNNKNVNISVNQLNDKAKKNFKTRFIFSFLIIGYLIISLLFFVLAGKKPVWIHNDIVNQVFGWIMLVWLFPIIYLAAKEIVGLHFKYNNFALFFVLMCLMIVIYTPTLIYFLPLYKIVYMSNDNQIFWFLVSIIICFVFLVVSNLVYLWTQALFNIRQLFVHLSLMSLVSGFFLAFLYFGFIKSWTTVLLLYLVTSLTDTFAYLTGMLFGKRKFSPNISPNKTIAGFFGGVILSCLICLLVLFIFSFIPDQYNILGNFFGVKFKYSNNFLNINNLYARFPFWWLSVFFILLGLSISSVVGDLSFSFIKRLYGIKDFSNLIPGHGGILDRIDSLSFVFSAFIILISMISLFSSTSPLL